MKQWSLIKNKEAFNAGKVDFSALKPLFWDKAVPFTDIDAIHMARNGDFLVLEKKKYSKPTPLSLGQQAVVRGFIQKGGTVVVFGPSEYAPTWAVVISEDGMRTCYFEEPTEFLSLIEEWFKVHSPESLGGGGENVDG